MAQQNKTIKAINIQQWSIEATREYQDIPADFQPIPSEDARKRTENVHPSMQFSFIEKKTKHLFWDFYD